ncbi:TonB family protein [Riemerella anatipestifer]|uniref:energy transducer TonB n=1 Tax=Riemerella anatipestifer TaxID=34085 RepID=UPI0013750344|nr:TonB family protein [Riemerella anatipestifer]MDY3338910.1 TonB family protein [Riemerella anatipestifer]
MKTKNLLTITALLSCLFVQSQTIYTEYPKGQYPYIGGQKEFYKDFHDILMEQKLLPCENKKEFYTINLVVYPDKSINYIKPEDIDIVKANKCTFELTKEVLKYMDKWKPAIIDSKEVAAITSITVIPNDLFDRYTYGYTIDSAIKEAEYEGGIQAFRNKMVENIDIFDFKSNGKTPIELLIKFTIEKDGKLSNVRIENSSGSKEFDKRILDGIKGIKKKWSPKTLHGEPIESEFNLPIKIEID